MHTQTGTLVLESQSGLELRARHATRTGGPKLYHCLQRSFLDSPGHLWDVCACRQLQSFAPNHTSNPQSSDSQHSSVTICISRVHGISHYFICSHLLLRQLLCSGRVSTLEAALRCTAAPRAHPSASSGRGHGSGNGALSAPQHTDAHHDGVTSDVGTPARNSSTSGTASGCSPPDAGSVSALAHQVSKLTAENTRLKLRAAKQQQLIAQAKSFLTIQAAEASTRHPLTTAAVGNEPGSSELNESACSNSNADCLDSGYDTGGPAAESSIDEGGKDSGATDSV